MLQVPLASHVDLPGFREHSARLLAGQVPPDDVQWAYPVPREADTEPLVAPVRATLRNRAARALVPQSFVRTSELAVLHRDPDRFQLLYRTLWRLVHEADLSGHQDDADLARLRQMAHGVRRDMQKMKARLVFRTVQVKGRPLEFAWYEPAHHVCEAVGAALARRKAGTRWVLLTPDRCVLWDGAQLFAAPPLPREQTPAPHAPDAVWVRVLEGLGWV